MIHTKWKPHAEQDEILSKLESIGKTEEFYTHVQRMRYMENPLEYEDSVTCRKSGDENHLIRFSDIEAEIIFKTENDITIEDSQDNPELLGTLHFTKCLLDGQ